MYIQQTLIKCNGLKLDKKSPSVLFVSDIVDSIPLLICSDVHFDSLKCDHASLKKHFDMIKEKNGQIIVVGDWFDIMGCHKDPRSKPADINPIYIQRGRSYLDLVVEDSFEFLKPYKENLLMMTYGNHETSILKHRDTDPLDRLVFLLNMEDGKEVHKGSYSGWIKFLIARNGTSSSRAFNIAYHHGKGGNAKRSKGILYSQMDAMEYPDANLIVSGHDHNKIYDPSNVRRRLNDTSGKVYHDTVHWLKTGSYKRSSNEQGWEVERGFTPKKLGGWFVDLEYNRITKSKKGEPNEDYAYIEPTIYEAVPVPE